jgi:hypothetical protein
MAQQSEKKNVTWKGILAALFLVMALLQLLGFTLILARFHVVRTPSLVLGVLYIIIAALLMRKSKCGCCKVKK